MNYPENISTYKKAITQIDFDRLIMIWVEWWVKQNNTRSDWMDYTGKNAEDFKNTKRNFLSKIFEYDIKDFERVYGKKLVLSVLDRPRDSSLKTSKKSRIVKAQNEGGKISYNVIKSVSKQVTSEITLMIGGEISASGGYPGIWNVGIKISGSAAKKKTTSTTQGEQRTISFEKQVPKDYDLIIEEHYTQVEYNQPIKISGSVVVSCANKINPGDRYAPDGHQYTKWAIPISIIFSDLKKLDIKNNVEDAADFSDLLDMLTIDKDSITINLKMTEEEVDTYTATPKLREEVKSQFDEQINKLKVSYQNYNKNIRIKRLFGGQLTVDNCSQLLLEEEISGTKKQEPKISPSSSLKIKEILEAIGSSPADIMNLGDIKITREEINYSIEGTDKYYTADIINILLNKYSQQPLIQVYAAILPEQLKDYEQQIKSQSKNYVFIPINVAYDEKEPKRKNHWAALIIDKKRECMFYLDPAQKPDIPEQIKALKANLKYVEPFILNPIDFQEKEKEEHWIRHCGVYTVEIFKVFAEYIDKNILIIKNELKIDDKSISIKTALSKIPSGEAEDIKKIREAHIEIAHIILTNEGKKGTVVSQVGQAENNAKSLKINDILNDMKGSKEYRALICGEPGVGKTSLIRMLTYHLSIDKKAVDPVNNFKFEWILQISLKNLKEEKYPEDDFIYTMENIVTQECFPEEIFQEIRFLKKVKLSDDSSLWEKKLGEILREGKALVILDGAEEMPDYPLLQRIYSELRNLPYVIITSRPYDLRKLLDVVKFKKQIMIKGFSNDQIKHYIINYFKDKGEQFIGSEQNIINFLHEKDLIEFCRVPFSLEATCYTLAGSNSKFVDANAFDKIKEDFYGQLLESLCRRYLSKFTSVHELIKREEGQEYNPMRLTPDMVFEVCKYELGLIEHFAFSLLTKQKEDLFISDSLKYLQRIDNNPKMKDMSFSKVQLNFGFLMIKEIYTEAYGGAHFYFTHILFMQYFAARYLAHCLQVQSSANIEKAVSIFPHVWSTREGQDVKDYIKANGKKISHQPIWKLVKDILESKGDLESLKEFSPLIDNVFIKPSTLSYLKEKIANLPSGYILNLSRENLNQIKITCLKSGVKKAQTLISLCDTLERLIKDNTLEDIVKLEIDDEKYELLIISQDSSVINAIAQQLKIASGQLLSQLSLSHAFFSGVKSTPKKTDSPSDEDKTTPIACPMQ